MSDLLDPAVREEVTDRLADLWRGRPVVVAPVVLAGAARLVGWLRELGCPVLVLATARGTGPLPTDCEVLDLARPATVSLTEELRTHDRLLRRLPDDVRAAVDAFDPERNGVWSTTPFVTTDEPVEGRPVTGGRPAAWLALEDKLLADDLWDAVGVARAPYRHVEVADRDALAEATAELAGPLGAVWSGDAREGFNGGADFVRWVREDRDRAAAAAFFAPRCDRVRVAPFLEGVPCSIHGMVLPGATAVFRPVEIVVLRSARRGFVLAGVGSTWDPPAADREVMRDVARRVGEHLRRTHDYRGAFGVDGVLTADGFRPTELNTRLSAGLTVLSEVDRRLFTFLQSALVAGVEPDLTAADLERLVPVMDAERAGKVTALAEDVHAVEASSTPVAWNGERLTPAAHETGNVLSVGPTPSGLFAKVDPCAALVPGQRLAPLCAALHARLDEDHGTSFGPLEAAPDVRVSA